MNILFDSAMAIPIGVLYNMIIHETGDIFLNKYEHAYKTQQKLLLTFVGGIMGLILAGSLFGPKALFKNRAIRYGLYFGSILLLIHTLFNNWGILKNDTKYLIMVIALFLLIVYAYNNFSSDSDGFYDDKDYVSATYVNYPELFDVEKKIKKQK